jgi:hypothetical protein
MGKKEVMPLFDPILIVVLGACFGAIMGLLAWFNQKQTKRSLDAVKAVVSSVLPGQSIVPLTNGHELSVEGSRHLYFIKVLPFHPAHELIVTNPTSWCVNDKPRDWRRSSKPNLIPGVADFLSRKPAGNLPIIRIGVVVPNCHNITRYLNESDVEIVKPGDLVYGAYLMRLSDLQDFIAKAERK